MKYIHNKFSEGNNLSEKYIVFKENIAAYSSWTETQKCSNKHPSETLKGVT